MRQMHRQQGTTGTGPATPHFGRIMWSVNPNLCCFHWSACNCVSMKITSLVFLHNSAHIVALIAGHCLTSGGLAMCLRYCSRREPVKIGTRCQGETCCRRQETASFWKSYTPYPRLCLRGPNRLTMGRHPHIRVWLWQSQQGSRCLSLTPP